VRNHIDAFVFAKSISGKNWNNNLHPVLLMTNITIASLGRGNSIISQTVTLLIDLRVNGWILSRVSDSLIILSIGII
jgi:hypothetical protein